MMAEAILVPQVGQDLTEAKVVELHVKLGDRVKKGDLVAVVESEKASFEVEAFSEGIVISLPWKEGDTATVLEPLMLVGEPGEVAAEPVATKADTVPDPAQSEVVQISATAPQVTLAGAAVGGSMAGVAVNAGRRASPIARRMALGHGLDIARIAGTGPRGAVVLRDVAPILAERPATMASGALEMRTLQAGQGTPVVFLHGFGADLSSWRPLVARVGLGSPLMALDLPGHGGSVGHGAKDFADLVEAVGQTLKALHGGVHLVGHSLGAAVATALTERGDLDVRSLTLIAPAGLGASVDGAFVDGFLSAQSEAALAAWMRRLVSDPATLAPVLVRATLSARADQGLIPAQTRVARGVFEGGTQLFNVAAALRRFAGPVSVIAGRDDAIVPLREIEAALPAHVALYRFDKVGHLPQIEAAELVQTIIARTVRSAG
jgi:pimeloyl-ACP methyl ester carboxylesterase